MSLRYYKAWLYVAPRSDNLIFNVKRHENVCFEEGVDGLKIKYEINKN